MEKLLQKSRKIDNVKVLADKNISIINRIKDQNIMYCIHIFLCDILKEDIKKAPSK